MVAAFGVAVLGVFCFLSVLQLAMLSSKEKVVMKYSVLVIVKVALGLLAGEALLSKRSRLTDKSFNENLRKEEKIVRGVIKI